MKLKNLGALFLLSLASIYFICPVQCAVIPEAGGDTASNRIAGHQQHRIGSQTVDETNLSACCQPENELPTPYENHADEAGHCCLNQWDSLGASEPQLPSQVQKNTYLVVLLIPTTPTIFSGSVAFTAYLQLPYKPYTDPPISQLSPRAPPFSLA